MTVEKIDAMHVQLKLQTKDVHEALHHHQKIGRLMMDDLTEAEYYRLLVAYDGYYRQAEKYRKAINAWPELSLGKTLSHFDVDLNHQSLQSLSVEKISDWQNDELSCLGVLYVLHGASLGGRMIAKKINKTLPHVSTMFFQLGVGMAQWQTMLNMLSSHIQQEAQLAVVVASARRTFVEFGIWVDENA